MSKLKVEPCEAGSSHRTGSITNMSPAKISLILGFAPNVEDDPDKVVNSWSFKVKGKRCAIWDYKGSHLDGEFSTYGDKEIFEELFGKNNVNHW